MKKALLLYIVVFLSSTGFSQTSWTLDNCLRYALDNNIQIKQSQLLLQISKNNLLQSKLNMLPTLSGDGSYSFSFGNSVNPTTYAFQNSNSQSLSLSLNGSWPLFTGLQQINNIYRNQHDSKAAQFDLENTTNNTALTITNQFLQIVLAKELLKTLQKQKEISEAQLNQAKKRITSGVLAETAVYEFDAQLARDNAAIINQQNNVEISLLILKIALQIPDQENFDIEVPEVKVSSEQDLAKLNANSIYDFAMNNQPVIKAADARVKSSLSSVKIAKGTLSPTLALSFNLRDNYFNKATKPGNFSYYLADLSGSKPIYADFSSNDPTQNIVGFDRLQASYDQLPISFSTQMKNNFSKLVSFSLNVPIFSGWKKMTNIANARLQNHVQLYNLENTKNNLRKDIYQAVANVKANAENYLANQKTFDASKKAFDVIEKRLAAGLSTSFEWQQSRNNLYAAESRLLQAKYSLIWSQKVLDFYQGKAITFNQ